MSSNSVTVQGVVTPDGKLELDSKLPLAPGKVQVTVETLSLAPTDHPFWRLMQDIWAARNQAGLQPRSEEEIEDERRSFRDEAATEVTEAGRLQKASEASSREH